MGRTVEWAAWVNSIIAQPGNGTSVRGGRRVEALVSVVVCTFWVFFASWAVVQAVAWALAASAPWAGLAWVGVTIAVALLLFSIGLAAVVAVGARGRG